MKIKINNSRIIINRITNFYSNAKTKKYNNSYGWDEVRKDIDLARSDTNFTPYNTSKQEWVNNGYKVVINKRGWVFAYLSDKNGDMVIYDVENYRNLDIPINDTGNLNLYQQLSSLKTKQPKPYFSLGFGWWAVRHKDGFIYIQNRNGTKMPNIRFSEIIKPFRKRKDDTNTYAIGQYGDKNFKFYLNGKCIIIENRGFDFNMRKTQRYLDRIITETLRNYTNKLLTEDRESKNMSKARKYIRSVNPNADAQQMIDAIRTDIPNSRIADCKFLMGVARMYLNGELNDQRTIRQLNQTLKLIGSNAHVNEYDQNLNNETVQSLIDRFATSVLADLDNQRNDVNSEQYQENGNYQIIPIDSFDEAEKYGQYTSWCVTHDEDMYETYTNGGSGRFYFCLRNGFENEEEVEGENCPLDSYGLSMIAVSVNEDGSCNTITCRWNHDNDGNDHIMTDKELSRLIGRNFYQVFKPYTEEELRAKGIMTFEYAKELLAQGVDPEKIFSYVDDFCNGFARVALGDTKWNFINTERRLLSDLWFNYVDDFCNGFARVKLNNKWNLINTEGEYLFDNWFEEAKNFNNGFVAVKLNNKWNFINTEGEYLFDNWFDWVIYLKNGFYLVQINDKWNLINTEGEFISSQWFDKASGFDENGFADAVLNGKYYSIDTKGQLYDYETKQPINLQNESLQRRNKKRVIKLKESELRKMVVESIKNVLCSL